MLKPSPESKSPQQLVSALGRHLVVGYLRNEMQLGKFFLDNHNFLPV